MFMLTKKALKRSLMAIALPAMLCFTVTACSDDDDDAPRMRTKEYAFTSTDSTANGKVTIKEKADSTIEIAITLNKSIKDTTYNFGVFKGEDVAVTTDTLLALPSVKSTGAGLESKATVNSISYDSAMKVKAFARISFVDGETEEAVATKKILDAAN
ncbi:hypothetical protein COR50_03970 [Chitinophaga caeni]|uniref:DUF4625 domain-containing protein n=1 Tax=Chitinophaga caeni TaxID=2029983 RepID=A0A291QR30_9BACT|nr:hypothetical protein [Chitinophaga caeni]ATL46397.1 hypothetical protein COR50_03970 [Chitinophaga caeni]